MTTSQMRKQAILIVEEMARNQSFLRNLARTQNEIQGIPYTLIPLKEAAKRLGVSKSLLYHIKDRDDGTKRFSYVKNGNVQSSPILFEAEKLVDEFKKYIAEK